MLNFYRKTEVLIIILNLNIFFLFSVSFGGIMGLFLGVSLLSGVELIYYVIRICKAAYTKIQQRRQQEPTAKKFFVSNNKVLAFKTSPLTPPTESDYTTHYLMNI
jgi:hypothetical protein